MAGTQRVVTITPQLDGSGGITITVDTNPVTVNRAAGDTVAWKLAAGLEQDFEFKCFRSRGVKWPFRKSRGVEHQDEQDSGSVKDPGEIPGGKQGTAYKYDIKVKHRHSSVRDRLDPDIVIEDEPGGQLVANPKQGAANRPDLAPVDHEVVISVEKKKTTVDGKEYDLTVKVDQPVVTVYRDSGDTVAWKLDDDAEEEGYRFRLKLKKGTGKWPLYNPIPVGHRRDRFRAGGARNDAAVASHGYDVEVEKRKFIFGKLKGLLDPDIVIEDEPGGKRRP